MVVYDIPVFDHMCFLACLLIIIIIPSRTLVGLVKKFEAKDSKVEDIKSTKKRKHNAQQGVRVSTHHLFGYSLQSIKLTLSYSF